MSLSRYSEYKDSGVEWLGDVPGHWEVAPLKHNFKIVGGSTPKSDQATYWDGEFTWVTPSDLSKLSSMNINDSQRKITSEGLASCGTSLVPSGSIVLSTRAPIGSLAIAQTELCTNQGCKSLVPLAGTQPQFYGYLLSISTGELNIRGKGTTFLELSGDELGAFKVGVPPNSEQQNIAAFLDRETGKIDALIAEQRRLVELLAEKRQAVISHAVTKGLGTRHSRAGGKPAIQNSPRSGQSDCPAMQESSNHLDSRLRGNDGVVMKDSGIEWLGEVPEHWGVMSLKRDLAFLTSGSRGWADHYADEGALFIRIGNLPREGIQLDLSDIQRVNVPDGSEGERTKVKSGDVLFSITAYLGSVAVVPEDIETAYVSQHVALARLSGQLLLPRWVAYLTLSLVGKTYLETQGYGGTKIQLSLDDIKNIPTLAPPLEEQRAIVSFLETETAKLDTLTLEANRAIALLQERRSALISAAVTGKIDVRYNTTETGAHDAVATLS